LIGLLGGLDFEAFYKEADMLMALRNISWSDIKSMTYDEYLIAHDMMYANQKRVRSWLGRFF
jgi:6-phosphogluconolactonase/glucosamine-6-phosphate isomerase/deaminase